MVSDRDETPELVRRRADGKLGKLWTVECYYHHGAETSRHHVRNLYWMEVREFRARAYSEGIMRQLDPGHWIIISPFDIDEIHLWKQKEYFIDLYYK
jgi:hypothetical protein